MVRLDKTWKGRSNYARKGYGGRPLILGLAVHYASQSFTISVLRLNDRQDWRDTPHIVIYVVLYPEIHIIYFRTRTHAYYSMSSALILLTYEIENLFVFFSQCYGGNQVGVTYCMGQWGLAKFGDVVGCILSRTPPKTFWWCRSGLVLGNVTWPPPPSAVQNHPPLLQRHQDIYLPQLFIATIKSPLGLTIHYLILQWYRS